MLAHIYVLPYIIAMKLDAAEIFKLLADNTRLRCLLLLQSEGELCVCELIYAIGESQPKISRHLATLRNSGLVVDRKEGLWVHYRLNPDLPAWVSAVLSETLAAASTQQPYAADLVNLSEMPNRPGGRCCA
jgi:ArsR family transcriptional regulator